jgi:hypothetical protein
MKKILFISAFIFAGMFVSNAQELGVRFGNISAGNVAIDGVFSTGEFSKIHADVSFGSGVGVDLLWDFLYRPINGEAFKWYIGAGPYAFIGDPFQLGVLGEIGLDYHFNKVPISISADWRPYFRIIDNTAFGAEGFGLNIRYVFGKK